MCGSHSAQAGRPPSSDALLQGESPALCKLVKASGRATAAPEAHKPTLTALRAQQEQTGGSTQGVRGPESQAGEGGNALAHEPAAITFRMAFGPCLLAIDEGITGERAGPGTSRSRAKPGKRRAPTSRHHPL